MFHNGSLNYSNKAIKTGANGACFRFQFCFNPKCATSVLFGWLTKVSNLENKDASLEILKREICSFYEAL